MRPTRHDWPDGVIALSAIFGAIGFVGDHAWYAAVWCGIALILAVIAYARGKARDEWKAAYLAAKARADRAQWGGHLS